MFIFVSSVSWVTRLSIVLKKVSHSRPQIPTRCRLEIASLRRIDSLSSSLYQPRWLSYLRVFYTRRMMQLKPIYSIRDRCCSKAESFDWKIIQILYIVRRFRLYFGKALKSNIENLLWLTEISIILQSLQYLIFWRQIFKSSFNTIE